MLYFLLRSSQRRIKLLEPRNSIALTPLVHEFLRLFLIKRYATANSIALSYHCRSLKRIEKLDELNSIKGLKEESRKTLLISVKRHEMMIYIQKCFQGRKLERTVAWAC
uniref:Uncharacterized protein n=1 Tax=Oryza meridionalis TaxID=40149 RepID=A0A0E0EJ27_9ORYZ